MNQKGFTLIELLVALSVGTVVLLGIVNSLFLVIRAAPEIRKQSVALADTEYASYWLTWDIPMGANTDLVNGAPPVAQMTMTWNDYTQEAVEEESISHSITYTYSGSELQRNYDGVVTLVGRQLTSVGFSINDRIVTVTLTASEDGDGESRYAVTRKYKILMRGEPSL